MPRRVRGPTTARIVEVAREQRRTPVPSERRLWEALRNRRFAGLKFRRQHPYGGFVLDTFCVECQLAVEVDGASTILENKPNVTGCEPNSCDPREFGCCGSQTKKWTSIWTGC